MKSVTPAFLYAVLLWQPVRDRARHYRQQGAKEYVAMERAAEDALTEQVRRTAIPRRFSAVTRQIWMLQIRLQRTHGRGVKKVMHQQRFRAAYDFLLLRVEEDPDLAEFAQFWTEAQKDFDSPRAAPGRKRGGRRRPRRRKKAASGS